MSAPQCRFCAAELRHTVLDLGVSPLANSYLTREQLRRSETFYPLVVRVCERCLLVQADQFTSSEEIFQDYAYFSSYSSSWLDHCRRFADEIVERCALDSASQVVEIGSNDGYLLQYFAARGIPVLGVEPAANVAAVARSKGVATLARFFGVTLAQELRAQQLQADLLIGNNVFAHVPELNDFVAGLKLLLKAGGVITLEFPHVLRLLEGNQFDTIYHEHFSYLSCLTADEIFRRHGLTLFDVQELSTHGGSLRVYVRHSEEASKGVTPAVAELQQAETLASLRNTGTYSCLSDKAQQIKRDLLSFLIAAKCEGKSIVGYGAPAKGNTLLNWCGIRSDFLDYTVDLNPEKQQRFLPGTHIPIHNPDRIRETRPDYVLILPWNLRDEIAAANGFIREWGGRFVVAIPKLEVFS